MLLSKPVIAGIEGHAVAGGLELALWCDLRVVAEDAVLGVFCRRWGVPLVDGGTIRLPRLVGQSHALDLVLTGRAVAADEALRIGLANRVVPPGAALAAAVALGHEIAAFPQACLRSDRLSLFAQWDVGLDDALVAETIAGTRSSSPARPPTAPAASPHAEPPRTERATGVSSGTSPWTGRRARTRTGRPPRPHRWP